ncbi:PhzF family phenazine biosynthesis protein [Dickeya dadantii]|uniref:PhzF family phenazine biosynthesis protein n=1 Tax=Dickeya dadantii TaxID=204038 RepID=UPI001495D586|nr:PhzF family phenazine biosynthesis protein [Dickeya dadantii]NPE52746.1 PhzF family phenazine biosynthesis protein [Dickeya dadantii]NPE55258.1 PhzF family phenazine biosynthesis protein [Dickeya dadantii]NPE67551.1 PhzF family phenazine biosynthesis protein [Dickeya dadantii]
MSSPRRFKQVDVFSHHPAKGNPLAVILDADSLSDEQMQAIARWTNLSETTFVLPPDDPLADYRVRIFTPSGELPFAGHPTLGTAHALLESGLTPHVPHQMIQQCGVGLVPVAIGDDGQLAFRAPDVTMTELDPQYDALLDSTIGSHRRHPNYRPVNVRMGIRWLTVRMESARACLDARPDATHLQRLQQLGQTDGVVIYGPHDNASPTDYEVRAFFVMNDAVVEDPVTGSANACIARVIQHSPLPEQTDHTLGYRVRQGTMLYRDGRVNISYIDGQPWIGGHSNTLINGHITL